jgi:gliding motility-associated-like protein
MNKVLFYTFTFFCFLNQSFAQLTANAGPDQIACYNGSLVIGGTPSATGGTPPYKYSWSPSTFLSSTTVANPTLTAITSDITYTLTVTDFDTTIVKNTVFINLDKIFTFNAGIDTGYCFGQQGGIKIGASNNNNAFHNFSWQPTSGLDNASSPNPIASPSATTVYTLTVSDTNCPDYVTQVVVTAFTPPIVNAGADTTIDEGQTITLVGTGAVKFWWQPDYNIKYMSTSQPDVWPTTTTVYNLFSIDQHGCYAGDDITVNVRNGDVLFFYSAFTPNNDGENDVFFIGNLGKYPDNNLKIYNRYGKQVYSATNYDNSWNGTYLGNLLPTGTYFYIFNDGKDKQYKGSVTIIR